MKRKPQKISAVLTLLNFKIPSNKILRIEEILHLNVFLKCAIFG